MRYNLKNFELKAACSLEDPQRESSYRIVDAQTGKTYKVGRKPQALYATQSVTLKTLPIVIAADGRPWRLASYYLMELALHQTSDPNSIQKYAVHLGEFYDFCVCHRVDPLLDTPSKRKKPIF